MARDKMNDKEKRPNDIDEYISGFPEDVQRILEEVRATIRSVAPDAEETISYGIPSFTLGGKYLVYFAGFKKHVSVYPAPIGHPDFAKELSVYGSGKGTAKFPLDEPIPHDVIRKIVRFRVGENRRRAAPTSK